MRGTNFVDTIIQTHLDDTQHRVDGWESIGGQPGRWESHFSRALVLWLFLDWELQEVVETLSPLRPPVGRRKEGRAWSHGMVAFWQRDDFGIGKWEWEKEEMDDTNFLNFSPLSSLLLAWTWISFPYNTSLSIFFFFFFFFVLGLAGYRRQQDPRSDTHKRMHGNRSYKGWKQWLGA